MGKASSAKKVARAARAGGSRRPGQRRQLGFPVLIIVVVVAGIAMVAFARNSREANAAPQSQAQGPEEMDHWHAALGISDCGSFIFDGTPEGGAFLTDALNDPQGIHTHGDGVIHIHPFLDSAGGRNARMSIFFDDVNLQAADDTITFPDGTVWDEAEKTCEDGGPGQIVVARWNSAQAAADGEAPSEIITEDFGDIRFKADGEYFTIAFVPEGQFDDIPVRPDILDSLNNLSDLPPSENIDAPEASTTTTTAADGTASTTTPTTTPTTTAAG